MEKVYLGVNIFVSPAGITTPISVQNEHGRTYDVQVITRRNVDALTVRYTVLISGREVKLYHELHSNRWYGLRGEK
ncbi:MAG: hypothetical protein AAGU74_01295 [Bacillota bacterium]